jgi:hypothetical protein
MTPALIAGLKLIAPFMLVILVGIMSYIIANFYIDCNDCDC